MKFFFLAMMLAYLAGNVYIYIKALYVLSALPSGYKILVSILFWILASSLFISLFTRDVTFPLWLSKFLYTAGSSWMVFTLYMVIALIFIDIVRLCIPNFAPFVAKYGFSIAAGFVLLILAYGYYNYKNPKINKINIMTDKNASHDIIKIVAVSDVHLGNGTGKKQLGKYVELINAQKPDLILIAGDLIDNSVTPLYRENMAEELNRLDAPMGIYMVPGNHEYISGISKVEEFLKNTPIQMLRDTVVTLPCGTTSGYGITIIGRDDRFNRNRKSLEELMAGVNHSNFTDILLDHQPYELAKTDSLGIAIQVSGHTHRGQVWPLNWLTDNLYEQSHGYRKWQNTHIYISSGLSLWGPPFRIGTESEIVVLCLTAS